jgi:hypothetical protein
MPYRSLVSSLILLCLSSLIAVPSAKADEKKLVIEPTKLEGVNTPADEDDPFVVPDLPKRIYDGPHLFYVANNAGKAKDKKFHIMVSKRKPTGVWQKGQLLEAVNGEGEERSPFLLHEKDSNHLFFASTRLGGNFDIFRAMHKDKDNFLEPGSLNNDEICTEADELHPWVTAKGTQLYFSRKTKEGWRIFVSLRPGGIGAFEKPHKLDLPPDYFHATLSEDGKTMYLQGPAAKERWALYKSTCDKTKIDPWEEGAWSKPEPLDRLNSLEGKKGDCSPCLVKQGQFHFLYFASDRPGGEGGLDLYMVNTKLLGE